MDFKNKKEARDYFVEQGNTTENAEKLASALFPDESSGEVKDKIEVKTPDTFEKKMAALANEVTERNEFVKKVRGIVDEHIAEVEKKLGERKSEIQVENPGSYLNDVGLERDIVDKSMDLFLTAVFGAKISPYTGDGKMNVAPMRRALSRLSDKYYQKVFGVRTVSPIRRALENDTNVGSELILDVGLTKIFDEVKLENALLSNLPIILYRGKGTLKMPLITSSPTLYLIGENIGDLGSPSDSATKIKDSNIGTENRTFTWKKLGLRSFWDSDFDEDAMIAGLPLIKTKFKKVIADALERIVMFGDTTTGTTNMNYNGSSPTTTAGQANYWLAWNGICTLCLGSGSTTYYNDVSSTISVNSNCGVALDSLGNYAKNPMNDLIWVFNHSAFWGAVTDSSYVTVDKMGNLATQITGMLGAIFNVPVIISSGLPLHHSDGKVSSTAANNTKTGFALVYKDGVQIAIKREMTFDWEKKIDIDAYHAVSTMRADCQYPYADSTNPYGFHYSYDITRPKDA